MGKMSENLNMLFLEGYLLSFKCQQVRLSDNKHMRPPAVHKELRNSDLLGPAQAGQKGRPLPWPAGSQPPSVLDYDLLLVPDSDLHRQKDN